MKKLIFMAALVSGLQWAAPQANAELFNFDVDAQETMDLRNTRRPPPQPTDAELFRAAGLFWSDKLEDYFEDEKSMCEAEGGEWDARQNICLSTIEAIRCFESGRYWVRDRRICVDTIADVCRAEGGVWNLDRQECLRSLDAIECVATGGIWVESDRHCVHLFPDPNA